MAGLSCNPRSMGFAPVVGVTAIFLLHRSLFSLREPGARVVRCGAMHADAIYRAHPIPLPDTTPKPVWTRKDDGCGNDFPPKKMARTRGRPRSFVTLFGISAPRRRFPLPRLMRWISMPRYA